MLDPDNALQRLENRESVDFCYSNGLVRSSKEIVKLDYDHYMIFHDIDGTCTYFTKQGIREVLTDQRSAWEGDRHA